MTKVETLPGKFMDVISLINNRKILALQFVASKVQLIEIRT